MKLGYVLSKERGETDRLLAGLAEACLLRGWRLAGVVQTNTACSESHLCDMDVRVLPDGPVFRISQSLGPEAKGCRLDPAALEDAVGAVIGSLSDRPDLLIVNKFGKHEADGRGFRDIIGHCLIEGIPVIAGTNTRNLPAFQNFTEGFAQALPPKDQALLDWAEAAIAAKPHVA